MEKHSAEGQEPRHPIRVVARRTGLSLHVLRAWERRYAVVAPVRSKGGQRLYSDADIARLRLLSEAVAGGRSISQVASLDDAQLTALVAPDRRREAPPVPRAWPTRALEAPAAAAEYLRLCLGAAERLDSEGLQRVLRRGVVVLQPHDFLDGVIAPLLHEVGERWHRGELTPAQEHAASVAVGRVLDFLLASYEPAAGAPVLVSTTVAGELHELGAMLASVVAAESGWRVVYLGPSLPAEEIARAATLAGAAAVAVSAVSDRGGAELVSELRTLRVRLHAGVRLLVGGSEAGRHAAALEAIGEVEVLDLEGLRQILPRASEVGT
jgi:DNA-binding transcriptional MerR regulator/methylmalonyl-CoA mutase cobalamin-binding subunit